MDGAAAGEPSPGGRPRDPALDEAIIRATRRRLVLDGYSKMTLGDIASDAGVSRPTLYRRWSGKFALVVDALDWGFRAQLDSYPPLDLEALPPREAFAEAVRRVDPCYANPEAIVLQGGFMGEQPRAPELLELLRERAVEPRLRLLLDVLTGLQERGHVRADLDTDALTTMCFGSFFGAFLRGDPGGRPFAERVVDTVWALIAVDPGS
ncbi:TetR/AcrR family transcriptional regulator [Actinomycetospora soli]|uniref:TetR/AcrR family transcriptional regulator n=1 Tax=Actinomycetospora soli TaxID=2893887 RepID=UPI001E5A19CB|nr:TetR/AcrR family transcriptional regulator [Actinomycetospora soli]MCD2189319.1 TetR/AcrR family transcriptional regulator [Actinomycetospora soli]